MPDTPDLTAELSRELQVAIAAARTAGAIQVDRYERLERIVHKSEKDVVTEVERMGGLAAPCHPGRPTIGLCEYYASQPPLDGVVCVEALNGGSRRGENERVTRLALEADGAAFTLVNQPGGVRLRIPSDAAALDPLITP